MEFIGDPYLVLYLPLWLKDSNVFPSEDLYGHLATRTGAIWTPEGHKFNGSPNTIIIPHHSALSFAGSFYLAAWMKFTDLTNQNPIMTKMATGLYNYHFYMNVTNPHISLELYDGTNNPVAHSVNNSIVNNSTFYFVEGIVTKGVTAQCFVNLVGGTAVTENTGTITNTANIGIGHRILATAGYAKAIIGEEWAYPRVPTLAERTNKYQSTRGRYGV